MRSVSSLLPRNDADVWRLHQRGHATASHEFEPIGAGARNERYQTDAAVHRDPDQGPLVQATHDDAGEPVLSGRIVVETIERLQNHFLGADAGVGSVLDAAGINGHE